MKIIILSQYFYPEIGAPQNRLLELSELFIKENWEVSVITAMPNYPKGKIFKDYAGKFSLKEKINSISVLRYWLYSSISARSIPRIFSMLSFSFTSLFGFKFAREFKPDYLLIESPPLILGLSAMILAKLCKAKLIMNVSDIWPLTAKELGSINDGLLYKLLEKLEKFLYRESFLCSGQSEEITDHIKKSDGKKVYLFRNGVDTKRFTIEKINKSVSGNFRIVYAGLIGVAQGIPDIVKNIDFIKGGAEIHIYGEGSEKATLENIITENPDSNIFLHKSISREEIPELLSKFDCSLIPLVTHIYGAVPSKIYEAMAAGLPILFSGTGEGASIVNENKVGLVSLPKDFESLTENILSLKNSDELRNEMSENGRRAAEEKFDRNKIIKQFSDTLKKYSSEKK